MIDDESPRKFSSFGICWWWVSGSIKLVKIDVSTAIVATPEGTIWQIAKAYVAVVDSGVHH